MNNIEAMALVVFVLTLVLALISWGLQLFVGRKLKKAGVQAGPQIGKRSWMKPFRLGWESADRLEIRDIMIVWSFILGLTVLGVIVTALLFASMNPS